MKKLNKKICIALGLLVFCNIIALSATAKGKNIKKEAWTFDDFNCQQKCDKNQEFKQNENIFFLNSWVTQLTKFNIKTPQGKLKLKAGTISSFPGIGLNYSFGKNK